MSIDEKMSSTPATLDEKLVAMKELGQLEKGNTVVVINETALRAVLIFGYLTLAVIIGLAIAAIYDPSLGGGKIHKRNETGAVVGGCVAGTVVLVVILSMCFMKMCRR